MMLQEDILVSIVLALSIRDRASFLLVSRRCWRTTKPILRENKRILRSLVRNWSVRTLFVASDDRRRRHVLTLINVQPGPMGALVNLMSCLLKRDEITGLEAAKIYVQIWKIARKSGFADLMGMTTTTDLQRRRMLLDKFTRFLQNAMGPNIFWRVLDILGPFHTWQT